MRTTPGEQVAFFSWGKFLENSAAKSHPQPMLSAAQGISALFPKWETWMVHHGICYNQTGTYCVSSLIQICFFPKIFKDSNHHKDSFSSYTAHHTACYIYYRLFHILCWNVEWDIFPSYSLAGYSYYVKTVYMGYCIYFFIYLYFSALLRHNWYTINCMYWKWYMGIHWRSSG